MSTEIEFEELLEEHNDTDSLMAQTEKDERIALNDNVAVQENNPKKRKVHKRIRQRNLVIRKIQECIAKGMSAEEIITEMDIIDDRRDLMKWFKKAKDDNRLTAEQCESVLIFKDVYNKVTNNGKTPKYVPMHKTLFRKIPCMKFFIDEKIVAMRMGSYVKHIQTVCDFVEIYPYEILDNDTPLQKCMEVLATFAKESNKPMSNYLASFRTFLLTHSISIPKGYKTGKFVVEAQQQYPDIELTDKQFEQCLFFLDEHYPEYLKFFAIQHETFARSNALEDWTVTYEMKQMEIDGELCEYLEIPRFFEPKTQDYWTKRIFDHRVIHILQSLDKNTKLFPRGKNFDKYKRLYHDALRAMYKHIGLIPSNVTKEQDTQKGSKERYIWKNPAYTLRHSGARMWVRRSNHNPNMVATMGWNDVGILTKHYAGTTDAEFFSQQACEVCSPRKNKFDNMEFCSTSHSLLHFQREKNAS